LLDFADIIVATFEVDVLDCDGLAGSFVEGAVNDSKGAALRLMLESVQRKVKPATDALTSQLL